MIVIADASAATVVGTITNEDVFVYLWLAAIRAIDGCAIVGSLMPELRCPVFRSQCFIGSKEIVRQGRRYAIDKNPGTWTAHQAARHLEAVQPGIVRRDQHSTGTLGIEN